MIWSILERSSYEADKHIDHGFEDSYNYLFYNFILSGKICAWILWNNLNSWGPIYVDCDYFVHSWGCNVVDASVNKDNSF